MHHALGRGTGQAWRLPRQAVPVPRAITRSGRTLAEMRPASHGTGTRTEDLCTTLLPNAELKVDYERHRGMNRGDFHHDNPLCFWSNLTRPEFDARKGNWNGFDKFFEDHDDVK